MRIIFLSLVFIQLTSGAFSRTLDENVFDRQRQIELVNELCKEPCYDGERRGNAPWRFNRLTLSTLEENGDVFLRVTRTLGEVNSSNSFQTFNPVAQPQSETINLKFLQMNGIWSGGLFSSKALCDEQKDKYCSDLRFEFAALGQSASAKLQLELSVLVAMAKGWSRAEIYNTFCSTYTVMEPGSYQYDWCQVAERLIGDLENLRVWTDPKARADRFVKNKCGEIPFEDSWVELTDLTNDGVPDMIVDVSVECPRGDWVNQDGTPVMDTHEFFRTYVKTEDDTWLDAKIYKKFEVGTILGKTVAIRKTSDYCGNFGEINSPDCRDIYIWEDRDFSLAGWMLGWDDVHVATQKFQK